MCIKIHSTQRTQTHIQANGALTHTHTPLQSPYTFNSFGQQTISEKQLWHFEREAHKRG